MVILFKFIIYNILITLFLILWITNSTKKEHNFIFFYINIINFQKLLCNL